ncbi:MAG: hypothetical protein NVSMB66_2680 [Candidatus Doudnabacteria bacterium]
MNIDGVNKKSKPLNKVAPLSIPYYAPVMVTKKAITKPIGLLSFFDRKQLITIVLTFVFTFALSIATSQGLASFAQPTPKQESLPVIGSSISLDNEFAVTTQPDSFKLNQEILSQPDEVFLPKESISLPDPLKKRREFLVKYLKSKNSPLSDHVAAISEQSQWKLIIAISRAESSFCKHQVTNNCWGIGGAWNMKNYKDFEDAVTDVNRILEKHYIQAGLNTPRQIVGKYVGHRNDNWQAAVEEELKTLSSVN